MTEQDTKKRIEEINAQIEVLNEERKELQKNCNHSKYRIGLFSWRIGCFDPRRICNICDEILMEEPTKEEYDQFKAEDNLGQGKKEYKNESN